MRCIAICAKATHVKETLTSTQNGIEGLTGKIDEWRTKERKKEVID